MLIKAALVEHQITDLVKTVILKTKIGEEQREEVKKVLVAMAGFHQVLELEQHQDSEEPHDVKTAKQNFNLVLFFMRLSNFTCSLMY